MALSGHSALAKAARRSRSGRERAPGRALKELYRPIADDLGRTEALLARAAQESKHIIRPMARHLLKRPGKRIRAALVLFSARAGRADSEKAAQLAAAVEMLHVASLIHDDILDGAETRRSQPALHARWGTHRAILMGDYLFARIFSLLAEHFPLDVTRSLLSAAHTVCDGAIEETALAFKTATPERRYLDIIGRKTGALMAAACECGAITAGVPPAAQKALREYGRAFGMAFQLVDDALDFNGSEREMGKPLGSDLAEGKFTMPVISVRRILRGGERRQFMRLLNPAALSNGGAGKVIRLVNTRGGVARTMRRAKEFLAAARESLVDVPEAAREPLCGLADYALNRRK